MDGDGKPRLITCKCIRAHSGKDAGSLENPAINIYAWHPGITPKNERSRSEQTTLSQRRIAELLNLKSSDNVSQ